MIAPDIASNLHTETGIQMSPSEGEIKEFFYTLNKQD